MPAIYYYYFLNLLLSLISSLCDVCAGLNVCVASVKKKKKNYRASKMLYVEFILTVIFHISNYEAILHADFEIKIEWD